MRVNLARLVFSQSCSWLRSVVPRRLSIIVLMLSLSSATSPRASTWIDRVRSPLVTAVATSAIARTWVVRLAASRLTLPVRSFQVPAAPGTLAWPPSRPSTPTSRATLVTCSAKVASVSVMLLIVSASAATSPFASTVSFWRRLPSATAVTTLTMPRTWSVRLAAMTLTESVRSFQVPATPGTSAWPPSLPSVPTSRATRVTSAANDAQLIDHRVDGVLQLEDLALDVDGDLARQVAAGDGGGDLGDVAHLRGQVRAHDVDRVGEVLPRAGDAGHDRLHAEPAFGADLARDARHFRRERAQLLDHRVDGFLELQDFAADVDGDLARQVAVGDRDGHLGDVAHLAGEVRGHRVDVVGEVLPGAGDAGHERLAAELAFGADLARDAVTSDANAFS